MVRNYVRKRQRPPLTDEDFRKMMKSCEKMSVTAAARKHGIPREQQLLRYICKLNDVFYVISQTDVRRLAYDLAERLHLKHRFKSGLAGKEWFFKFKSNHPEVKIRGLKGSKAGHGIPASKYFRRLSQLMDRYGFDANDIYNMDEIGITYCGNGSDDDCEPAHQVSPVTPPELHPLLTGSPLSSVYYTTTDEAGGLCMEYRKQLATAICCFNAIGSFLPPAFVFSSEKLDVGDELTSAAPPGSVTLLSEDESTNHVVFVDWLRFFVKHVRSSKDRKVLLLMDNNESHVSLGAYDYATEHGVVLLSVPADSKEDLMPFRLGVYGQLAKHFGEAVFEYDAMAALHEPQSTEIKVVDLFGRAYLKACNMQFAVNGFKESGIWPRRNEPIGNMCEAKLDESDDNLEAIDSEDEVHMNPNKAETVNEDDDFYIVECIA